MTPQSLANYTSLLSVLGNKLISILAGVRACCMYSRNVSTSSLRRSCTPIIRPAGTFPGAPQATRAEQPGWDSPGAAVEERQLGITSPVLIYITKEQRWDAPAALSRNDFWTSTAGNESIRLWWHTRSYSAALSLTLGAKLCFRTAAELFPGGNETKSWKARQNWELPVWGWGFTHPCSTPACGKTRGRFEKGEVRNQRDVLEINRSFFVYCWGMKCIAGVQGALSMLLM